MKTKKTNIHSSYNNSWIILDKTYKEEKFIVIHIKLKKLYNKDFIRK